jgi:hypothetical protein
MWFWQGKPAFWFWATARLVSQPQLGENWRRKKKRLGLFFICLMMIPLDDGRLTLTETQQLLAWSLVTARVV